MALGMRIEWKERLGIKFSVGENTVEKQASLS